MALTDVDDVAFHIGGYHEERFPVATDIKAFALAHGKELRSVVPADNLSERIVLVTGAADMLLSGTVSLGFEDEVVVAERLGEPQESLAPERTYLFGIEHVPPPGSPYGLVVECRPA